MSYLNTDVVRVRQLFAFFLWDDDIFLKNAETLDFFFPELCAREKAKIPRFNQHLEDLSALWCQGARPGQCSGPVS